MSDRATQQKGAGLDFEAQLLEQVYRLPMDGTIGPELFQLVAILLTHVAAIEERLRGESQ